MPDAIQIQLRGGTTAQHATFTGAAREVTVDTTSNTLVVHDGTTAGGHEVAKGLSLDTWTITESSGSLYFAVSGVNKMKLDSSGNLDVVGNVNTNATIS